MKNYYFCENEEEWRNLIRCNDSRQSRRHTQLIDISLRRNIEREISNLFENSTDINSKKYIDKKLIKFDPEMEYFPNSYWQISLIFFTFGYNIIGSLHDVLIEFCKSNNTWFSIWIDAHPIYIILFPDSDIIFRSVSLCGRGEVDKDFSSKIARYGLGISDENELIAYKGINWLHEFFGIPS